MWRCYRCETFNNQDYCFICGLPKTARVPIKTPDEKRGKGASPAQENVFRFGVNDNERYDETEKKKTIVSPLLIVAVILIVLIFIAIIINGM